MAFSVGYASSIPYAYHPFNLSGLSKEISFILICFLIFRNGVSAFKISSSLDVH